MPWAIVIKSSLLELPIRPVLSKKHSAEENGPETGESGESRNPNPASIGAAKRQAAGFPLPWELHQEGQTGRPVPGDWINFSGTQQTAGVLLSFLRRFLVRWAISFRFLHGENEKKKDRHQFVRIVTELPQKSLEIWFFSGEFGKEQPEFLIVVTKELHFEEKTLAIFEPQSYNEDNPKRMSLFEERVPVGQGSDSSGVSSGTP
ncbi:MAG: hypothetical protein ACLRVT_03575 [Oscillospiraceae bacterium]